MREKLFNLIGQVQDCGCDVTDVVAMNFVENDKLVDWLIANGVTIQKWIPVTERLPDGECLAISMKHGPGYKEQWIGYIYFDEITEEYICETDGVCLCGVTHWTTLPEPPKGE